MLLSQPLFQTLIAAIRDIAPDDYNIDSITPVSGGDINQAYHIQTRLTNYFVKINGSAEATKMFLAECAGLAQLRRAADVCVPKTFMVGQAHGEAFLLMEWLNRSDSPQSPGNMQELLGRMVAKLHRQQADTYGLDHDNFIGTLPQTNREMRDWTAFFAIQRLQKQLVLAERNGAPTALRKQFDCLIARLDTLYPHEPPSLLHGDLWSGNYIITTHGQPVLIDPAVYYGNREVDLAMTKLFGGFTSKFYAAYEEEYPLAPEWEQRVDLWNLYPLLVHFNLFGAAYLEPIQQSLHRYI